MAKSNKSASSERVRLEIVAANLRYGTASAPLRIRAYAQVVTKVLLSEVPGTQLKIERIRQKCRDLLRTGVPTREAVQTALSFLIEEGQVEALANDRFRLVPLAWTDLTTQVAQQQQQVAAVIERHFPFDIDGTALRQWFEETAVRYFAMYGDRWVAATARRKTPEIPYTSIEQVATATARDLGLAWEDGALLALGFRDFLASESPEDAMVLWHFGRAMFAARLMAADLAADPISAREMEGALLVLDTNVLLAIATEKPELFPSLDGVARALERFAHQSRVPN